MSKLQRFNPWPIFIYNSKALRGSEDVPLNWAERLVLYGTPTLGLGLFVTFRLHIGGVAPLLSATSLLVGAMLSTFVFLSNLRIKIQESEEYRVRGGLKELVASSAVGALHVSAVSMALALALALIASWDYLTKSNVPAHIASGICVWLLLHLLISLAAVMRRLFAVYVELFTGDFMAKPDARPNQFRKGS